MPELPEVETVRRICEPYFTGKILQEIEFRRPNLRFPLPETLLEYAEGALCSGLRRHGKYLLFEFVKPNAASPVKHILLCHLGMTGRFAFFNADGRVTGEEPSFYYDQIPNDRHAHVIFTFQDGSGAIYQDPRRFGFMDFFAADREAENPFLKKLGPDGLKESEIAESMIRLARNKNTPIKNFILDQSVIAGVGNIYASEALWRVGIHPHTPARQVPETKFQALSSALTEIFFDAILAGGSVIKDFTRPDGVRGAYSDSFSVYDRAQKNCFRKGCEGVIERVVTAGRATYFCGRCQPFFLTDEK